MTDSNTSENVLICGPNWLGDTIMCLPAIREFKNLNTACRITVLAKPKLCGLWKLCPEVSRLMELHSGIRGTSSAARAIREEKFSRAFIFPNSFRSALIPFLGRIPLRIGPRGHQRAWLLTRVVHSRKNAVPTHQAFEYFDILGLDAEKAQPPEPKLSIPAEFRREILPFLPPLPAGSMFIGLIPGAARGPSKRWPPEYFAEAGRQLVRKAGCRILVFGTEEEKTLCHEISSRIGEEAVSLAGSLSLPCFAACLQECRAVISNDSGGMHLAGAAGTRVVAIFGVTNPAQTGVLGRKHRILAASGVSPSRDIERQSSAAEAALRSISPEKAVAAVLDLLRQSPAPDVKP